MPCYPLLFPVLVISKRLPDFIAQTVEFLADNPTLLVYSIDKFALFFREAFPHFIHCYFCLGNLVSKACDFLPALVRGRVDHSRADLCLDLIQDGSSRPV